MSFEPWYFEDVSGTLVTSATDPRTGVPILVAGGTMTQWCGLPTNHIAIFRSFVAMPDLVQDGRIDGLDLAKLLAAMGECASTKLCPADFSGDGVVNGIDLATLLAAWGSCSG